jgi:hypothetical protein
MHASPKYKYFIKKIIFRCKIITDPKITGFHSFLISAYLHSDASETYKHSNRFSVSRTVPQQVLVHVRACVHNRNNTSKYSGISNKKYNLD